MIPQANITAWRPTAPWQEDAQVEQDLVLTRALVQLFMEPKLAGKIALRGGTALHKLFIQPAHRYSEDIDLVQTDAGPIGPLLNAIRANLDPWLGTPRRDRSEGNVTLTYRFQSEIPPVRPLRLKIEINSREHFSLFEFHRQELAVQNPWFTGEAEILTYQLDELLGTKLRALYQRRKGRDLFDLWLCFDRELVNPQRVVTCFGEYLQRQGHTVTRAQFEQNLHDKQTTAPSCKTSAPCCGPTSPTIPQRLLSKSNRPSLSYFRGSHGKARQNNRLPENHSSEASAANHEANTHGPGSVALIFARHATIASR